MLNLPKGKPTSAIETKRLVRRARFFWERRQKAMTPHIMKMKTTRVDTATISVQCEFTLVIVSVFVSSKRKKKNTIMRCEITLKFDNRLNFISYTFATKELSNSLVFWEQLQIFIFLRGHLLLQLNRTFLRLNNLLNRAYLHTIIAQISTSYQILYITR